MRLAAEEADVQPRWALGATILVPSAGVDHLRGFADELIRPWRSVVVLEFSRSPRAFREALLELDAVWELDSGVKVLVFPEHREAVKEAIRQASPMLRHQHVVVDPEFEAFVIDHLRQSLPGREKVRVKRRGTMALGPVDPRASGDDAQILDASDQ